MIHAIIACILFAVSYIIIGFGTAGIFHFVIKYLLRSKIPDDNYDTISALGWFSWIAYIVYFFVMILLDKPPCDATTFVIQQTRIFTIAIIFAIYYFSQNSKT